MPDSSDSLVRRYSREHVAGLIDHTLLAPQATRADAQATVDEAARLGVFAVCLSPSMLPIDTGRQRSCVVVGFPSGKHHSLIKGAEAKMATDDGAQEIDMVIDVGAAIAGDFNAVMSDVLTVREAIGPEVLLKVIIESAALLEFSGADAVTKACGAAVRGGASMVKTSTGFHPAGGASVEAVALMRASVPDEIGVKASGGIRNAEFAADLLDAGATRLGLSSSATVLDGFASA